MTGEPGIRRKYRPRVALVLIAVNLVIVLLPLASLVFFRIYESQLVRETETELIAQAAVLAAAYKQGIWREIDDPDGFGTPVEPVDLSLDDEPYAPVLPQIDLASGPILPPRPDARVSLSGPSRPVARIGEAMSSLFLEAQRATLAGMRLLDPNGRVIAGRAEIGLSLAHVPEVAAALAGRHRSVVRERVAEEPAPPLTSISRGTGVRVFVAFPVVERDRLWGVVYMSRTPNNIFYHIYHSLDRFLAIGGLMAGFAILIAWFTSRTLLRPIRALSGQAQELAEGQRRTIHPLAHYGTSELATLGQSFLDMAQALDKRSQYVRDFATHVSHEFKTPLTAIRGAGELLSEHHDSMDQAERQRFLDTIEANGARLKALVDRLLELARADNPEAQVGRADLAAEIEKLRADRAKLVPVMSAPRPAEAAIAPESFQMIAGNLIQNAEEAGATFIEIALTRQGEGYEIRFHDNGHGVSAGNRGKIYEPFFTTRREAGGTGLGLGIVRSLAEAHHGSIALLSPETERQTGATFALRLPA
ncbi:MAG: ATP-binding protein [Pseudomonadota bacterium]